MARSAALGAALLGAWATAIGCSDTIHTVGQLEKAPAASAPPHAGGGAPSSSGSSSTSGGSGSGASVGGNTASGAAGNSGNAAPAPADFDASAITDPDVSCEGSTEDAQRERLDLYVLIDRNVTLSIPWAQITRGLTDYANSPEAAGTGLGVSYFPAPDAAMRPMCDPNTYVTPDTPIEMLPGNATAVEADVPTASFAGSPTSAALSGALRLAASRRNGFQIPQAVVLITDVVQDFVCFTEAAELETLAATAHTESGIPTFVIALTVPELQTVLELIGLVPLNNLDAVAANGGTQAAREVGLNVIASNITGSMTATLLSIQHDAEPCRYQVPATFVSALDAGPGDLQTTVLGTAADTAPPLALPHVGSETECGQGYFLDDPVAPEWATLCKQTCDAVKAGKRRVLWLTECAR